MKKIVLNIYGFLHSLKYPSILISSIKSMFNNEILDNKTHIKMAADWLLYMQNSDGGYSRKFGFISDRDNSYIETTGYIIPTLLKLKEEKYISSALKAGEWLLSMQNDNGSFNEIDTNQPFIFDTGQVLLGLNSLYLYTKEDRYKKAIEKAALWLVSVQNDDGSWERFAYNNQKHTYYSRVAYALYEAGEIVGNEKFKEGALKNIRWVLSNQLSNGFFKYSSFLDGVDAYLHTIVYVLEGLLDIYDKTKDKDILEAVLKNSAVLKDIGESRDFILCSQYNENFECTNRERCITGLAQWAGVALRLYKITKDKAYLKSASSTLYYLKAKQLKTSIMKGGFSASSPFWGRYGGFEFVNWSNKFFIDSMILYDALDVDRVKEQEFFVSNAFNVSNQIVTDNISEMDKKYIASIKKYILDEKQTVLDVGCGKGVMISELQKAYQKTKFVGIDPVYEDQQIKKGSIYNIIGKYDVIMTFEVLQHTIIDEALSSIYNSLKPGGMLIIGDRNPLSLLGVLKPFYEISGRWMYPFDSPFREKWYNITQWEFLLKTNGFKIKDICYLDDEGSKVPKMNRYYFIAGERV